MGRSTSREPRRFAQAAVGLVFRNLEPAYSDGRNREALANMQRASHAAGIPFLKSCVGYIHTVAHFLGGQYNIPHGMAKSVRLPNVPEACGTVDHKKLHALAIAAGISNENERHAWTARQFIAVIQKNIPMMANHGEREANALYPVPVLTTAEEREAFCHQFSDWSKKS